MSEFKIGDKVRVKNNVDTTDFSPEMKMLIGKEVNITSIQKKYNEYYVKEINHDDDGYFYDYEIEIVKDFFKFDDEDFKI